MDASDPAILDAWDRQLRAFAAAPWPVLLVSNEVGWGPVPEDPTVRRFRDLAGWLNQRAAGAAQVFFRRRPRDEIDRLAPGDFQNLRVAQNIGHPQRGQPGLFGAEELARPAQL